MRSEGRGEERETHEEQGDPKQRERSEKERRGKCDAADAGAKLGILIALTRVKESQQGFLGFMYPPEGSHYSTRYR